MDVEHLWQYNESELNRLHQTPTPSSMAGSNPATNPLLASAGLANGDNSNPDLIANLCNVADHRLYKIVKWCKSLPLFKNISVCWSTLEALHMTLLIYIFFSRLTIKFACSSIRGVNCYCFRVVFVRYRHRARWKYQWENRLIWFRPNPMDYK